jgi:lipopolysaccharide transport system permease protein
VAGIEPVSASHPRVVVLDGARRGASRESLEELHEFREVFWAFVLRFVKVRYKQAVLGVAWAVIQPLAAAGVLAIVLSRVSAFPSDGLPYLLFVLAGMVAWTYFSTAAGSAMESLVTDRELIRKVYFPREVIPLAAVTAGLVDLLPGLILLSAVGIAYGEGPGVELVALPIALVTLVATAAAVGLAFSALNAYYRDFRYVLPYGFQIGLFMSPVFYPLSVLPAPWEDVYGVLNPVAAAIEGIRDTVAAGRWPDPLVSALALVWALVLLAVAYLLFKRHESELADRL